MWISPVILEGRFARLEPLVVEHAADLLAAAVRELFRFTPQAPKEWSVAGFEADIRRVNALAGVVAFAVRAAGENGQGVWGPVIGRTTYMEITPESRGVEIGRTWISRQHQGTKVNPQIKYLMLRHAFEELSPTAIRVQLTTGHLNMHSQRAIEKLGAKKEGVLRKHRIVPSSADPASAPMVRDTVMYSITDDEWAGVKRGLEERMGEGEGTSDE